MVNGKWRKEFFYSPFTIYHLRKHLNHFFNRAGERVNFLSGVVEGEGGACGRGNLEALHDGLRAMMTCSNSYALLIQDCAYVVRVNVFDDERKHAGLLARSSNDAHALN